MLKFICILKKGPEFHNGTQMPIKHRETMLNPTSTVETIGSVKLLLSSIPDLASIMPLVTPTTLLQSNENSVLTQQLCSDSSEGMSKTHIPSS